MAVATTESILIVDDNPTNLSLLSEALSSAGFRVRVAVDGESAIAQVDRNPPALILLDVQMPGIDGFETCRRLKSNPTTQTIPIIFTTALTNTESKTKGFALGAVDYIPKPFAQEEVLARVQVHLQLKRLTNSLEQQVSDRTAALRQAQVQLIQQEKLSTLGELLAGVAHEINNPINFLTSNINPLREYVEGMTEIIQLYQQEYRQPSAELEEAIEALDLEFALQDISKILDSMTLGAERIKNLSVSLRTFSRADCNEKVPTNLHDGLDSTLMILQHRLKSKRDRLAGKEYSRPAIEVIKTYGNLPEVCCYSSQMNQVFMNILANAIDAIDEAAAMDKCDPIPQIQITTELDSDGWIVIQISDNALGIADGVEQRLFEPLFTTKPVGKGTGLGLSIAHQIIVEKHNGTLSVHSQPGQGAKFILKIPASSADC
ncbi:hybrid sensor histidine kinase/response regulator [Microcoleus sp. FACHB-1515]|uniref:sensor histidine kinase n=1 Tax=Cyanophyceae TaxID=3028117 RepID=UPI0016898888|nr:response regulator [Microcoleus sp. FACHB-1515]MBD2090492.1 hybrid sensor histidine kinase/response regulator [Microcoleus sp. FACHB-1515]